MPRVVVGVVVITVVTPDKDVVRNGDHGKVDAEHVEESSRVNAGSEEGWGSKQWEGSGKEAEI